MKSAYDWTIEDGYEDDDPKYAEAFAKEVAHRAAIQADALRHVVKYFEDTGRCYTAAEIEGLAREIERKKDA